MSISIKKINFRSSTRWVGRWFLWVVVGCSFCVAPALALTDGEVRESIQTVLSTRHPQENADYWRSLGPNAPDVIIALYKEEKNVFKKVRLIDALAWYDSANATYFLKQESENSANQVLQRSALRALAIAQGSREEEFLSHELDKSSPSTRVSVGKALRRRGASEREVAKRLVQREKNEWVKQQLDEEDKPMEKKNRARLVRPFPRN